jgi:hypothetical protein
MDKLKNILKKNGSKPKNSLLIGAIAGMAATLTMTGVMAVGRTLLPSWQQYPLAPRLITRAMASRTGLEKVVDEEPAASAATTFGHFGYGAFGGILYSAVSPYIPLPSLLKGLLFGIIFWITSYLGWIPLFGVLSPPNQHPRQRTLLMIVSHLVYGGATGVANDTFKRISRY